MSVKTQVPLQFITYAVVFKNHCASRSSQDATKEEREHSVLVIILSLTEEERTLRK